jgi:hypothetical protein
VSWRRVAVVTGVLCASVVPAVTASAHNGVGAAFKGKAGHYIVYAYDGELLPDGRIDYKLVLLNARTSDPVYKARPAVTASRPGDAPAPATVTAFGNIFFYNLPNPYPHDWTVHLRINGPLGAGRVDYRMHGAAPATAPSPLVVTESDPSSWPVIVGAAGGAVALVVGGLYLFSRSARRRRASPR